MTPKEADKIIKLGDSVAVYSKHFGESFIKIFIKRDRWNIYSADGGVYDRADLELKTSSS